MTWKSVKSAQTEAQRGLIKHHPHLHARAIMAINDGTHVANFIKEGPNKELRSIARQYAKSKQLRIDPSAEGEYVELDQDNSKSIADAFEAGEHNPSHPLVNRSYQALADETMDQYETLKKAGFKMVPWGQSGQPYQRSSEFIRDIRDNKNLYFFKTINPDEADSFGDSEISDHPLLAETGEILKDSAGRSHAMTYNDVFRAVHDIFGHGKEGFATGPRGEENAWRQHVRMYSPLAGRAMTTETRGQNSWVNFGPHLRRADGTVPGHQDKDYVPLPERPYAQQKAFLLPEDFSTLGLTRR